MSSETLANGAYADLRAGRYDSAVAQFRLALSLDPTPVRIRKDLAYTLLKRGDRDEARDEFERVFATSPADEQAGLEYAFLCYETGRTQAARRIFSRLKNSADLSVQVSAARAFASVDALLQEGIARWSEAVRLAPRQWSAHEELARLAESADQLPLAAEHYEMAWRLRPSQDNLLIDLARVWIALGDGQKARGAIALAWRAGPPRVAEAAREMLHGAVPDPGEASLAPPGPLPRDILAAPPLPALEMAERSLASSYVQDAYRFFRIAHEENPADAGVAYKLGLTSNLLHQDREALRWFDLARKSPEPSIANQASAAYETLAPRFRRFSFNVWGIPFYSSRWNGVFLYGQAKAEWHPARSIFTPYLAARLVGDTSGQRVGMPAGLQLLSENSVIAAAGLRARISTHLFAWAEAGQAYNYHGGQYGTPRFQPDYRGGLSALKGWGRLLGTAQAGLFHETNADGVYASRFRNDMLLYLQNRSGYTFARSGGGWQAQAYAAWNLTLDRRGEYWGNFIEGGAGFRVVMPGLPSGVSFRTELVRGAHLQNKANPWGPNYWDFRTGMWYAFSH
ncbi:MAG: tetratricopeptide repeat protein [Acidobacteria bacterium]|nr:tetratricopeptide repeat protein [Acidobacteriota bacterium]